MDCLILQVILWLPLADFCKDYIVGGQWGVEKHIPLQALLSSLYHTALLVPLANDTWSIAFMLSIQLSSVAQSCPTLCGPMNRSTPGLPVHHKLPEFTQTHVHRVGDAIQPSHPLSSPSPPASNPSQHQGLFQWVNSSHEVAKVLEFQAGQVVWYSLFFQNFPQVIVIHTVKGFGIVSKAEIDVFLELSCFFDNPTDIGNLVSGSSAFCLKPAWTLKKLKLNGSMKTYKTFQK